MINIIGLGPSNKSHLTLEAVEYIKNGNRNFLRTNRHSALEYFLENNIEFKSFDYLYESFSTFKEVYEKIVELLIEYSKEGEINYLVPGHPLVAEHTVELIIESGEEYRLINGLSFIEPMINSVLRDPLNGLIILDGDNFNPLDINTDLDILITQVYNSRVLSQLKIALGDIYSDEYKVTLVTDGGLPTEKIEEIEIYKLDEKKVNHQSSIYIKKIDNKDLSLSNIINKCGSIVTERHEEEILSDIVRNIGELKYLVNQGYINYYDIVKSMSKATEIP